MLMNLYRSLDRNKIQFDFLLHTKEECFFNDEIRELGGIIYHVKPLRLHNLNSYLKELNHFFSSNSYSIVHSHISVWTYFNLKIAEKNKIPVRIAHAHEAHDSIWDHRLHRIPLILILKKLINKPVTHRFACGEAAGKWMFGNSPFQVIHNAIDAEKFSFNPEKSKLQKEKLQVKNKIVFGHVGRFNEQKNHSFLIDVFSQLIKEIPKAHLLLVGSGPLKEKIEKQVQELQIENHVSFLGIRNDVPDLLQAMDYILMPSLFEGLPVSLIEAQASGLKIFGSNKISKEVDITGLIDFLEIENPSVWVNHIIRNLKYNRKNMYSNIIDANYDIANNAKTLTGFYLNFLNKK